MVSQNQKNVKSATEKLDIVVTECRKAKKDLDIISSSNKNLAQASKEQTTAVEQINKAIMSIKDQSHKVQDNADELKNVSDHMVNNTAQLKESSTILKNVTFGNKANKPKKAA